jgi:ABC-type multidrug transport system fused ATPase/permease subunit
VTFSYREGHDVLKSVDLQIPAGQRLAIVGPSGAGKSTLGRLIAGIHAPRLGTITIGDASLALLPTETVRAHVALVTQEHHVFVGSLRNNLELANPEATDEQLWDALRAVDAHEWARELPEQLQTTVGSGGAVKLSPSQAQQVALARLVLADPHTLVLDEATSLLDPRAARHLERSLSAVLEGRTVIAIAHRLHTAHDADRIVVVEDGQITEAGSHDELVSAGGPYAALWSSWRSEG